MLTARSIGTASGAGGQTSVTLYVGMLLIVVFGVVLFLLALIPLLMAYFAYLWGYFTIIVAILIGPILVPFILFPQTDFLFWGWIRSIFGSTVQVIVGGGIFAIIGQLMLVPMRRYSNVLGAMMDAGEFSLDAIMSRGLGMMLEFLPMFVIAFLAAGKVSEITSMVLNGGGVPSAGLSQRMAGVRQAGSSLAGAGRGVAGAARLGGAGAAALGGVAGVAGARVLSQMTKGK